MKGNLILRYRMIIVIAVTIEKFFHCIHKISFRRGRNAGLEKRLQFFFVFVSNIVLFSSYFLLSYL